jgi:hypothetical protein
MKDNHMPLWLYVRLWFMDKVKRLLDAVVGKGW